MADEHEQPSVATAVFGQPFAEQVAFFRQKLGNLVPTQHWDDLKHAQHDTGFMIAGAQKADFLAAVGAAIDKAISQGTGIEQFRKDFAAAVKQHNWHGWTGEGTKAGEAWRTRIIYTTNMSTSYAAGRYAQLKQRGFSHWVYHHADGVARPRPWHVAWDGLTLPQDDAFWDAHYPPGGWHCHCYVTGAWSADDGAIDGGQPTKPRPHNWNTIDGKTGEPVGIDKGFGYAPGKSVAQTVNAMAQKTQHWPHTLAKAYMQSLPAPNRDALAKAYRALPSTADDARRYARRALANKPTDMEPYQTLGLATQDDIKQIGDATGRDVDGYDFALDAGGIHHIKSHHGEGGTELARGQRAVTADDYEQLPAILSAPDNIKEAGTDSTGNPLVRYQKQIGDARYNAVFEIRKGRKMLVLKSYYINAPKK